MRRLGREADDLRELDVGRVAQHVPAAPDDDRRLLGADAELAQQRLGALVLLDVDPGMRETVARAELAQPASVRREARADQLEAGAHPDQHRAADQEGTQDEIAQRLVVGDDLAQLVDGHDEDLARLDHDGGQEHRLAHEEVQLAEEAPRSVDHEQSLAGRPVGVIDRDLALEDDVEVVAAVALLEQDVAGLDLAPLALGLERGDLLLAQPRKGTVAIGGFGQRRRLIRAHVGHYAKR